MSISHYVACHDCRVVGLILDTPEPDRIYREWIERYGHTSHRTEWADEFNEEFEATIYGRKIIDHYKHYKEPVYIKVEEPYMRIDNETLSL